MPHPTAYELWYGRDEPPVAPIPLRAGPLTALLVGRDLRNIRFGGLEVAQRIYVALRDRNWGTVPGDVSDLVVAQGEDAFTVTFTVHHQQHEQDIDFAWRGEIQGTADGTISYAMHAVAGRAMTYKLIGFNIHHGMREYVGRPYQGITPRGPVSGQFPSDVAPQLVVDETEVPIFPDVSSLTAHLTDDVAVRFDFAGDTFEFEDQRNWTDASFKSQSYPPRRGGFLASQPGDHIFQQVTLTVTAAPQTAPAVGATPASPGGPQGHDEEITITLGEPTGRGLPPIGFAMASHGGELSPRDVEFLRALQPAHLRVDLHLSHPGCGAELQRALTAARALDCGLELALFVSDDAENELVALGERLRDGDVPLRRILIFHETEQATAPRWLVLARDVFAPIAPGALLAGGADANFCELNRHRPAYASGDGVAYSINPQIHAFDERSMTENIAGQAETVATARHFSDDAPIVISPVTLKQRFNAVATSDEPPTAPGELPPQVDPRQMSLFAAGWTVGSINALARAGASSLTYYETTGWRGLIETAAGSPAPERFPARPGDLFPLYHVFADLAQWRDGALITVTSSDPLTVQALALTDSAGTHLLLANSTPYEQPVRLSPLPDSTVALRRLNAETADQAMRDPRTFRASAAQDPITGGTLRLTLAPFETVRINTHAL